MSKFVIYTAGAMEAYGGTDLAEEWRDYCKRYFKKYHENVIVVNPTDYYRYGKNNHKTDTEIFRFDLYNVGKSDVILVNLNDVRKSIGTCMELYEAYKSGIPVVGFLDDELQIPETKILIHPWVFECCTRIETGANSMQKAIDHIVHYYLC